STEIVSLQISACNSPLLRPCHLQNGTAGGDSRSQHNHARRSHVNLPISSEGPTTDLESTRSGHTVQDRFDCASQGEQILVATFGGIELEAERQPFRVQSHRQSDSRQTRGARWVRV